MSYADYYDEQAEATGWLGPEVVFGLAYECVRPGETLLDIGIGTGLGSALFHKAGLRILGMDMSEEMLEGTRRKGFVEELQRHDLTSEPYPYDSASIDHAVCIGVLHFFRSPEPVFREVGRMLRVGGTFAFTVGDRDPDEPAELTVGSEHTGSDKSVTMYMHSTAEIRTLLLDHGFVARRELEFATYMDAEKTKPLRARAYLAERTERGDQA